MLQILCVKIKGDSLILLSLRQRLGSDQFKNYSKVDFCTPETLYLTRRKKLTNSFKTVQSYFSFLSD